MKTIEVYVVKDEDGDLRPQAGIWKASGEYGDAVKKEWELNLSKKSYNRGCTLVRATLTEHV